MARTQVKVSIDGMPVSGVFFERLVSLTITDREGIRSDTLVLVFDDSPPHFASPRRGAVADVLLLSEDGGSFVGSYIIDKVDYSCFPHTISVSGHSADLRSEMKTNKARHWDDISVKDLVTEIAAEYELKVKISDKVSSHIYEWIGQQDETDLHFLQRLSKRHNALFTIKNGNMIWLERGVGQTASGDTIPAVTIHASNIVVGSCKVSEKDVDLYKTVSAYYHDRGGAARKKATVDGSPDGDGEHVIRDPYSSEDEAKAAANAYVSDMLRGSITTSCSVVGRPSLMAGQPFFYQSVRPGIDARQFIFDMVKHTYTKGGGLLSYFNGKIKQ